MERLWPHSPAPLVAVGGSIAASWFFGLKAAGGLDGRPDPARLSVAHAAGSVAGRTTGAGRAGHRADELHRNDCGGARLCPAERSAHQRQPRAGRHRAGQYRRRAARRDAGRRRHLADRRGARRGRAVAEGLAGHRRRRAGHHAAAGAAAGPDAECHAGRGRHRLLGRADPARRVPRHPQGALDGVSLGADRLPRCAGVRHAQGHRGGHHRVDDRAGEPDRPPARLGHRPQARDRRAAAAVAGTPRRRDLRGPADRAARGAPVLRQCAERGGAHQRAGRRSTSRACWRWT